MNITYFLILKKDFQRLKAALELSVRDILAEVGAETGCNFTAESSATISELVLEKSVRSASDLQAFAAHAKRQSVTAEDVRLLTRRNPELVSQLFYSQTSKSICSNKLQLSAYCNLQNCLFQFGLFWFREALQ